MADERDIELLYDRECPACEFYCQRVAVADDKGRLVRIDAREPGEIMDEVTALGLDIDEGMVLRVDDRLYYGAAAIHQLAKLSSNDTLFNRSARLLFGSERMARILYPVLKACRNLLLKMLGRTRINNLGVDGNERF